MADRIAGRRTGPRAGETQRRRTGRRDRRLLAVDVQLPAGAAGRHRRRPHSGGSHLGPAGDLGRAGDHRVSPGRRLPGDRIARAPRIRRPEHPRAGQPVGAVLQDPSRPRRSSRPAVTVQRPARPTGSTARPANTPSRYPWARRTASRLSPPTPAKPPSPSARRSTPRHLSRPSTDYVAMTSEGPPFCRWLCRRHRPESRRDIHPTYDLAERHQRADIAEAIRTRRPVARQAIDTLDVSLQ